MKETKYCSMCKETKTVFEFARNRSKKDGLNGYCRKCSRWRKIKLKYGLTPEEYLAMYQDQDGCCAICSRYLDFDTDIKVDHHHESGRVRKMLCHDCNTGIGYLKEDPVILHSAIEYLATA